MNEYFNNFKMYIKKFNHNHRVSFTACISLILIFLLFLNSTFAWFYIQDTAEVNSDVLTMDASAGLRVNEGESISNVISLENITLSEASSVDGRNMFFPTSKNFTDTTYEMTFREGTVGDQNQLYAYKNFTITGDSERTDIYVKSYKIQVDDQVFDGSSEIRYENGIPVEQIEKAECPIRIAFISDSADKPILIDPTALVDQHVHNYDAINAVSTYGSPYVLETDAKAFSNHYFSYNKPLFTLYGSQSQDITMVVWLESTADTKICEKYVGKKVSVTIELESNFSNTDRITFLDKTIGDDGSSGSWINSDDSCIVTMAYKATDGNTKTVVMNAVSSTEWYAPLPNDITTNISFYRYSLEADTIFNAWHTHEGVNNEVSDKVGEWLKAYTTHGCKLQEDRGTSIVYTAVRGNGYGYVQEGDTDKDKKRLSPCIGFWDYENSSGGGESGGGESGDGSIGSTVKARLYLNVPSSKNWISSNVKNGFTMYAVIDDTEYMMAPNDNCDYFQSAQLTLPYGSTLSKFILKNNYGTTQPLPLSSPKELTEPDFNYSFSVDNTKDVVNSNN